MIYKHLETVSYLIQRNEILKIRKNLVSCCYQQIKAHGVQLFNLIFMKQQLSPCKIKHNHRKFGFKFYEKC